MIQSDIDWSGSTGGDFERSNAGLCKNPDCGVRLEPVPHGGSPQRFCSPACRMTVWGREHPRVAVQKPDGATRCDLILGRLQAGPATGLDLLKAGGGTRYGARIKDLRSRGHRILGPLAWTRPDGTREEETVEPSPDGCDRYELRLP